MPTYSRTDRVAALYERRFYAQGLGLLPARRGGRIAMRDLLIAAEGPRRVVRPRRVRQPSPHRAGADPATRGDDAQHRPQLALRGDVHGRAAEAGDGRRVGPRGRGQERDPGADEVGRTCPQACRDFPLGSAGRVLGLLSRRLPPDARAGLVRRPDRSSSSTAASTTTRASKGSLDRGCSHWLISDGSGQTPDIPAAFASASRGARPRYLRPTATLLARAAASATAATGRLGRLHAPPDRAARARSHARGQGLRDGRRRWNRPASASLEDVQRALAQVRTDLDAFCEVEAWSLMADAYQLTGKIVPDVDRARGTRNARSRRGVAVRGRRGAACPAEHQVPQGTADVEAAGPAALRITLTAAAGAPPRARRDRRRGTGGSGCC